MNTQTISTEEKKKRALYNKRYRERNKEKVSSIQKEYYKANKEDINLYHKQYQKENKEKVCLIHKQYCETNKENIRLISKRYYKKNKESILKRHHKRMKEDPLYKTKTKLRRSLYSAFKRIQVGKPFNAEKLLGCSWEEAKAHFERLFEKGMTWANHGEWEIDHIRPVDSFKDLEDLSLMNHISNLQPLWKTDNRQKSAALEFKPL